MSFDSMWTALDQVGRNPETGGYRRYAWTQECERWPKTATPAGRKQPHVIVS